MDSKNINDRQLNLIHALYKENLDFRTLNQLKNTLYKSEMIREESIPLEEFYKISRRILG